MKKNETRSFRSLLYWILWMAFLFFLFILMVLAAIYRRIKGYPPCFVNPLQGFIFANIFKIAELTVPSRGWLKIAVFNLIKQFL